MRDYRVWMILLTACIAFLTIGCSGRLPADTTTDIAPQVPVADGLPALPHGDAELRQATAFDGVPVDGHPAFQSNNATPDGTSLLLQSGSDAWNLTAWAVYQLPEAPGETVDMISITAQYLDPDPVVSRPEEGYWLGYADYAADTWQLSGPFTTLQSRVNVPPEADVVSPLGFYYVLVLVCQEHQALVHRVEVGGYDGMGYEEYWLGRPPGHSMGANCDIQLDPDGIPQIAYLNKPYVLNDHMQALRVARKISDHWELEDIDLGFVPNRFSFAIGDGGRRILVVQEAESPNLWLLYDDNVGSFGAPVAVAADAEGGTASGVTFVNDIDDPNGDLNLAMIVYAKNAGGTEVTTYYRTYDGTLLTAESTLYGADTDKPARLVVSTNQANLAVIGVPDKVGTDWYCDVGEYSSGAWDFTVSTSWGPLQECAEYDDNVPDIIIRESSSGDYVGCYMRKEYRAVSLGRYSGGLWLSTSNDIITIQINGMLDIDAFSSGRTVLANTYDDMKPLLVWGLAGAEETYGQQFFDTEPWTATSSSIAIDAANNVHMACANAITGELNYIVRPPAGEFTQDVIDTGGLDVGGSAFFAWPVYANGNLHMFYVNSTHPGILHSENENGIWIKENEVIEASGIPYYVLGAGYLENSNLLYVGYLDYFNFQFVILSGSPEGDDWVKESPGYLFAELAYLEDDEDNVGIVGFQPSPLLDARLVFSHGEPQTGGFTIETLTYNTEFVSFDADLGYNPADGTWGFVGTSEDEHRVVYFQRPAPDTWLGPYTVADLAEPGEYAKASGLTYLSADGTPRIVVRQLANSDTELKTAVYTAPPGGTSFSALTKVAGLADADGSMPFAVAVPGPGGEPVIGVVHKLNAESDYDISLYTSDAPGSWVLHATWDSPLASEFFPQLAVAADGQPAVGLIDVDHTSDNYGGAAVYYPW